MRTSVPGLRVRAPSRAALFSPGLYNGVRKFCWLTDPRTGPCNGIGHPESWQIAVWNSAELDQLRIT